MKQLKFEDFEEFACSIADRYEYIDKEYKDVSIVAKYEEARQIIKELLCIGYNIKSININDEMYDDYNSEYIISISNIDEEFEIWCEPMLRDSGYLTNDSNVIYIMDNSSSKVIPYCKSDFIYEVTVGDDSSDNNETFVEYSKDNDGDTHGFTVSKSDDNGYCSYSYYTSDSLSKKDIQDMIKTFGFSLCE